MVAGAVRRTRPHVGVLPREVGSLNTAFRQLALWNATSGGRNIPRHPVKHVASAALQRDVDVVENDRVTHRAFRRPGELESRLDAAAASVLLRDDSTIGKRLGLHQQRWQVESPAAAPPAATAGAAATVALLLSGHFHTNDGRKCDDQ